MLGVVGTGVGIAAVVLVAAWLVGTFRDDIVQIDPGTTPIPSVLPFPEEPTLRPPPESDDT